MKTDASLIEKGMKFGGFGELRDEKWERRWWKVGKLMEIRIYISVFGRN
jgi:hypothetical protein